MLYIGGGAGMAPMRSHLYHLFKTLERVARLPIGMGDVLSENCFT